MTYPKRWLGQEAQSTSTVVAVLAVRDYELGEFPIVSPTSFARALTAAA
jgi:hypothetical protein